MPALGTGRRAPWTPGKNAEPKGEAPWVIPAPAAVQALSMALHELAPNAVKCVAPRTACGQLRIAWPFEGGEGLAVTAGLPLARIRVRPG